MATITTSKIAKIPPVSVLSPLVTRILGLNPGKFTLQGTNTYLIGQGRSRVLIDTGEGKPEYFKLLLDYAKMVGFEISAIMLTHWHADHIGGVDQIISHPELGKPRVYKYRLEDEEVVGDANYSSTSTSASNAEWTHPSLNRAGQMIDSRYNWKFTSLEDGESIQFDGFTLTGFHTPGHATDHIVYWLQSEQEQAMFSGDNVLGEGSTTFESLKEYMDSLNRMSKIIASSSAGSVVKPQNIRMYPAHGNLIDKGLDKLKEYISHRTERENDILKMMDMYHRENGLDSTLTVPEIVRIIYRDYPESLHMAAARGVSQHLNKLQHERKVEEKSARWKLTNFLKSSQL